MIELPFVANKHRRRLTGRYNGMVISHLSVIKYFLAFRQLISEYRRCQGCIRSHIPKYTRHLRIDIFRKIRSIDTWIGRHKDCMSLRVSSAVHPHFLLHSTCRDVRSKRRGGASLPFFFCTSFMTIG